MFSLLISLGCLFAAIVMHLFLCRFISHSSVRQASFFCFVGIFFFVYMGADSVYFRNMISSSLPSFSLWALRLFSSGAYLYFLCHVLYYLFFVTADVYSPTQRILNFLKEQDGLSYEELLSRTKQANFILPRIEDLQKRSWIFLEKDVCRTTPKGNLILHCLYWYQKLSGRPIGG